MNRCPAFLYWIFPLCMTLIACHSQPAASLEMAQKLAQSTLITDGHVDVPYRLTRDSLSMEDVSKRTLKGDFDFVRAKEGGLDAPFMSIYIPSSYQRGGAKHYADELIDLVEAIVMEHPTQFALAKSPDEVEAAVAAGKIALPMGMENGAAIEDDLANLTHFYRRGIRYITLTHGKDNLICDSSYDTTHTWNGLSPFGLSVVAEMNRLGIMIDVSHISDSAFYDVMAATKAPAIASHSSCRHFTPGWERNMSDDMIRRLAENGGVIQINFGSSFISTESNESFKALYAHLDGYRESRQLSESDPEYIAYEKTYRATHPPRYATVQEVADHIDHVVNLVGIDHVGIGSDYDGVGDSLPEGLKDVAGYPNLILELLNRGYSQSDIEKICYKNVFRVWREGETGEGGGGLIRRF